MQINGVINKLVAFGGACILSFGLFVLMNFLVNGEVKAVVAEQELPPTVVFTREDLKPVPKRTDKKPPPKMKPLSVQPSLVDVNEPRVVHLPTLYRPKPMLDGLDDFSELVRDTGLKDIGNQSTAGTPGPSVRIEPHYPRKAAFKGIQGYAVLQFDINSLGQPENIKILNAEPKGYFEKVSRKALAKWKYPTEKPLQAQKVRLDFNLES